MSQPIDQILQERGQLHGEYGEQARVTQALKNTLRNSPGWERLDDAKRDAAEMICVKMGRILAGNPSHADHWDDIAGYARLVSVRIPVAPAKPASWTDPLPGSYAPRKRNLSEALQAVDEAAKNGEI